MNDAVTANDVFTAFWNDVLVAKFERFRNIMMDGLSYHSREPFRHHSWLSPVARGVMAGFGVQGYALAIAGLVMLDT